MDSEETDSLYAAPQDPVGEFAFDERVAAVFPDMVRRSIPGYRTLVEMTGIIAARHAVANSRCYDLGCSLGASTLAMRRHIDAPGCRIVAVDKSAAMLERCRANLAGQPSGPPVDLVCRDIREIEIGDASAVVLNYTLQFIPPGDRLRLLKDARRGMRPGGVLILSEKIRFEDRRVDQEMSRLHTAFKKAHGYTDLEISQKRSALERVLVPDSVEVHRERLEHAGFQRTLPWFQCCNFVSLLAWR